MVIAPPPAHPSNATYGQAWQVVAGRLVTLIVGALAGASATGFASMTAVFIDAQQDTTGDTWEELNDAILAVGCGLLTWTVVYVLAIGFGVRWAVEQPRRGLTAIAILLCTVFVPSTVFGASSVAAHADLEYLSAAMVLLGLGFAAAVIGAAAGIVRFRHAAMVAGTAFGALLVLMIVADARTEQRAMTERPTVAVASRLDLEAVEADTVAGTRAMTQAASTRVGTR